MKNGLFRSIVTYKIFTLKPEKCVKGDKSASSNFLLWNLIPHQKFNSFEFVKKFQRMFRFWNILWVVLAIFDHSLWKSKLAFSKKFFADISFLKLIVFYRRKILLKCCWIFEKAIKCLIQKISENKIIIANFINEKSFKFSIENEKKNFLAMLKGFGLIMIMF